MPVKGTENQHKYSLRQIVCITFAIFLGSILIIYLYPAQYSGELDTYFTILYENTIFPKGEHEINSIVNRIAEINDTEEKLEAIAEWESENFTYFIFEKDYFNPNYSSTYLDYPINRYRFDSYGKIRPEAHSPWASIFLMPNQYANDPRWIAFYRMGGCGELAVLFGEVANRSGFNTSIIRADLTDNNHAWVEVQIGDEWYFFDPTNYYVYHKMNVTPYNNTWFNKPEMYSTFSADVVRRVVVASTGEDVVDRYPQLRKQKWRIRFCGDERLFELMNVQKAAGTIRMMGGHVS
ncbi:transglutaminase domain-containing protein [Methanoculleus sp. 7T]|jgi:hypothetical protein|uniref:transglutaminase domain-containing protein n=1 Tax=Methanoculleus sp. 7T TaxID=2937282 RepID=UPI0020BE2B37|nr:transglutaminase domain-containing protein [Methanoculleus sp. 7T]MCK8517401.1 transglutaminase domain-containing protein [Methanoculleus sp. 7T]